MPLVATRLVGMNRAALHASSPAVPSFSAFSVVEGNAHVGIRTMCNSRTLYWIMALLAQMGILRLQLLSQPGLPKIQTNLTNFPAAFAFCVVLITDSSVMYRLCLRRGLPMQARFDQESFQLGGVPLAHPNAGAW